MKRASRRELMKHLRYDPETGEFWWLRRASGRRMNTPAGTTEVGGYRAIRILGKSYKAHRLAWLFVTGFWPKAEIDHKNRKRADNRWYNLREATRAQNKCNAGRYKNNTSGTKGVSWHKQHRKWYATVQHAGKVRFLGLFVDKRKAKSAYIKAVKRLHGKFAQVV